INSITSQEFGDDYGDYYRASGAELAIRRGIGARGEWRLSTAYEKLAGLATQATPANGEYRQNSVIATGDYLTGTLTLRRRSEGFGPARTPGTLTLAPYVATGWAAEPFTFTPWLATPGTRVTVGLGAEWLGVFRLEAGYGVQSRNLHVTFDVTRDFWDIL